MNHSRRCRRRSRQMVCAALAMLGVAVWLDPAGAGNAPGIVGGGMVGALVIDPRAPTTLYAYADCGGVLKSTDGGDNWSPANSGLPESLLYYGRSGSLAIDPVTPNTLYLLAYPTEFGRCVVFKSTDGGSNWAATGLPETCGKLVIDPVTPSTLYASGNEVFKSIDGAASWRELGSDLNAYAIAIDPIMPQTLYLVANTPRGYRLLRSTNGGATFDEASSDRLINDLAIDPITPSTLYAAGSDTCRVGQVCVPGVFKSTDAGVTWRAITAGLPDATGVSEFLALVVDPVNPGTLYVSSYSAGLFKSTDGGNIWTAVTAGLPAIKSYAPRALAIDPVTPDTLYAGSPYPGVFKSSDAGGSWHATGLVGSPICGDGVRCGSESCDDGNAVDGDGCDANCTLTACGNGIVTAGEQCDNGGDAFDGCTDGCTICGNGVLTPPEECDDGNRNGDDACTTACRRNVCPDGFLDRENEQCDDGNYVSGDGCDSNCTLTACGNGIATTGEECDDGNHSNDDRCTVACLRNTCGDALVNPASEQCDDGNVVDGDGCDANCTLTACGNGIVTAGEECDDGNRGAYDGCTAECTICGDGIVTPPEECDDQNTDPIDGCTNACTRCGNGRVTAPERCDDGNLVNGDGCDADCVGPVCGDGHVDPDEDCDDGGICVGGSEAGSPCTSQRCPGGECRTFGGNGCAANCTAETVHQLVLDPGTSEIRVAVTLSGSLTLRLGHPREDAAGGDIPIAVRAEDVSFAPIPIGDTCVCIGGIEGTTVGEGVSGVGSIGCTDGLPGVEVFTSIDHNTNDVDPSCAAGFLEDGREPNHPHDGVCNGQTEVKLSGIGPAGSMRLDLRLQSWRILDAYFTGHPACVFDPADPSKGRDGLPCTEDDPGREGSAALHADGMPPMRSSGGVAVLLPGPDFTQLLPPEFDLHLTTGKASAEILDANNQPAVRIADDTREVQGVPLACEALSQGSLDVKLVGAVGGLDLNEHGSPTDRVTTFALRSGVCRGDCHADGRVSVDDLVTLVRIALHETAPSACEIGDLNDNGEITIDEILTAVSFALAGCR